MPLSPEEANAITATMNIQQYKKGTVLLKEGQISAEAYFVLEGCVRQFSLVDGDEKTTNFFTEEQWVVSISCCWEQREGGRSVQTISKA